MCNCQFLGQHLGLSPFQVGANRVSCNCHDLGATSICLRSLNYLFHFHLATVFAVGMLNAAYYLMVFNCVFYWLFSLPRVSSFKTKHEVSYHGGDVPDDSLILGQLESFIHTLNLLFFPLLFHIASHCPIVFSSYASLCDVFLLFFFPFLFQLYTSTRGALWWLTKNDRQLKSIRLVNGAIVMIAMTVVVLCLEFRVVFHSFGRYIHVVLAQYRLAYYSTLMQN